VLVVTPAFLSDPRCCTMLATVLQRKVPRGGDLAFVDGGSSHAQPGLQQQVATIYSLI
jgi:hypothetical protein